MVPKKPPITDQEFDLLERVIYRFTGHQILELDGDDADVLPRLVDGGYVRMKGGRVVPNDAGLAAASDYEHYLDVSGRDETRDPLTEAEFQLLDKINQGEMARRKQVDAQDLPLARDLVKRRLVYLADGEAELEKRGYRALFVHRPRMEAMAKARSRSTTAGEVLEELLGKVAATGDVSLSAVTGYVMRQRQELGRQLQHWAETKSPLDHCGATAWKLARGATAEMRELEGIRCGTLKEAPLLSSAGLAAEVDGALRLTARPHRWHITQAGQLRVNGSDVASGATQGLRAFGAFLHDMGYPAVRGRDLRLFRLGQPGESHGLVGPAALSPVTVDLVRQLSVDGGSAPRAGVYLGLSPAQWRRHAEPSATQPGPWATQVLRMLPAHPRVITWVLGLEEPLGRAVVSEILEHLLRLDLTAREGAYWYRTAEGAAAIEETELIDPYETWVRRHRDDLERLTNRGADFLMSLRRQLRDRARDAGSEWRRKDTVRTRHLSSVLRQAAERDVGHGCELAHALWARHSVEDRRRP